MNGLLTSRHAPRTPQLRAEDGRSEPTEGFRGSILPKNEVRLFCQIQAS
jgi:hypothetical protein